MENPVPLSLGKWPTEPFSRNFKTSPISLRVIKNAKVEISSILPVSFAQYVLENNLMNTSKTQVEQQYHREVDRRKKKVQILQGIWLKVKSKRSKSTKLCLSTKSSCVLTSSKGNAGKRNSSKSLHATNKKSKSKSPLFFNVKSPTKGSTYFDYYNTHHQTKANNKKSYEEESTQSRRQKTLSASRSNQQYFNNNWAKKNTKLSPKQHYANSMAKILKQLGDLEEKHGRELQQISDLTEREKRRLMKIHQIEKEKSKKQIEVMRSNLNSHKRITKGLN